MAGRRASIRAALALAAVALGGCAGVGRFYEGHRPAEVAGAAAPASSAPRDQETAALRTALDALAKGHPDCARHYGRDVQIGPALWARLRGQADGAQAALDQLGADSVAVIWASEQLRNVYWEMRSFHDAESLCRFLGHPATREVAAGVAGGEGRAATPDERSLFVRVTPVKLRGKSLHVFERGEDRLAVYAEAGKIVWLELLSGWLADRDDLVVKNGRLADGRVGARSGPTAMPSIVGTPAAPNLP
jgi:hypothetical protein